MPSQLPLPLGARAKLGRSDFLVAPGNRQAVAFLDAWPDWPAPAAALHGPAGSGKSHLVAVWQEAAGAEVITASALAELDPEALESRGPLAVEDVDTVPATLARDRALFALIERARPDAPLLLTGHTPPGGWPVALPDLASRFAALLSFSLWAPDDALLEALARKLFTDRQLPVPDSVIQRMIRSLERSPAAIRDFVARTDQKALAEHRPVNLALVRELIAECEMEPK